MSGTFDRITQVSAGDLDVGLVDIGPSEGQAVLLLHGWPYDIQSYADAGTMLAEAGYRVIVPYLRGYGTTRFRLASSVRNGQQAVFALDAIALLDALGLSSAIVAGFDWGARTASVLAALWPERCRGHVAVSGYLIGSQKANTAPLPPAAELAWWYQYYFATDRGEAGYDRYRTEFARLIWRSASPMWGFDEETFSRTAAALHNPDHVEIVIHNYRWRLGVAAGEPQYDDVELRLAERPTIAVPTITLEGDANGAPHPDAPSYRGLFVGPYEHRLISGGIGHNLPQEAPRAFADAVIAVDQMASRMGSTERAQNVH